MKLRFSRQNPKQILSAFLAFWLSGAALLFCCEMPPAKAAEAASCPLRASHCDKSKGEKATQFASFQNGAKTLDCCRFPAKVFDKARKLELNSQAAQAAAKVYVSRPKLSAVASLQSVERIYKNPVLNRSGTYLINCVFRI